MLSVAQPTGRDGDRNCTEKNSEHVLYTKSSKRFNVKQQVVEVEVITEFVVYPAGIIQRSAMLLLT